MDLLGNVPAANQRLRAMRDGSDSPRSIASIARDVRRDWRNVNYAARPYLDAMACLDRITDSYGADSARSVILYFLANAASWRGDTAKRIKAELKQLAKR